MGGKICFWILIIFFLIFGLMCNFIENVCIVVLSCGCLMVLDRLVDNDSFNGFVFMVNEDN